jgi:hypothetical protein
MAAECENDFVLTPHPLSFNGLLPLAPTCEPDGEKARRVQSITKRAVEVLRDRRAKWECGESLDAEDGTEPRVEMDSESLKNTAISKGKRKMMGEEEFEELWATAIGEIKKRDEIVSVVDGFLHTSDPISSSPPPLSLASPSPVPSDDPSDSQWRDIVTNLLL